MAAVFGALDLDHHQARRLVQTKQVNAAVAVLPVAELFAQHQQVFAQWGCVLAQHGLQVLSLQDGLLRKGRRLHGLELIAADGMSLAMFVDWPVGSGWGGASHPAHIVPLKGRLDAQG